MIEHYMDDSGKGVSWRRMISRLYFYTIRAMEFWIFGPTVGHFR